MCKSVCIACLRCERGAPEWDLSHVYDIYLAKIGAKRYKLSRGACRLLPPSLTASFEEFSKLAVLLDNPADTRVRQAVIPTDVRHDLLVTADNMGNEAAVELGIWLSGLESFLSAGHSFGARGRANVLIDTSKEFELTHSTLLRCLNLNVRLSVKNGPDAAADLIISHALTPRELDEFGAVLRDLIPIGECIKRAEPISIGEWIAWRNLLTERLFGQVACRKLIRYAEDSGGRYLPEPLKSFAESSDVMMPEQAELALVLPRFAKILRWLSVIGEMLQADEPLKPALLIFSRVNEQILELITYINNRLERFPNEEAELFTSLDGASYIASMELKKVYTQELAGLIQIRPSPSIYSGMETAYSVLNECFRQILAGMVRFVDPSVDGSALFPSFKVNFERSFALREELWKLVTLTKSAEKDPENRKIDLLNKGLRDFMGGPVRYLFFKDTETVERFVEEIRVAKQERDLVPILHRFGAYLETLFGQVNMRAVLENHPFDRGR